MRRLILFFLVIAGCVTPPADEPPADDASAPALLAYADCDELLGAFPVQPDAMPVPEGFAPAPLLAQGNAAIFVVGWSCAGARTDRDAAESEPFTEAFVGFSVTPPEEMRLEGAFGHALLMGLATGSTLGAETYAAWGIPASATDVAFAWQAAPVGGTGTLEGAVGPLDVAMRVNAGGPNAPEAASAVRFFVVDGNAAVAAYDIAWIDADGFQGQAVSRAALPGAPPATTGLGFYYTSDATDRYTMTPYALPNATADG